MKQLHSVRKRFESSQDLLLFIKKRLCLATNRFLKVVFFGEQSGKDIKGFLETFCKFRDHYNNSEKFIDVLKKKEAALEAKRQKEEEKERVKAKFENVAKISYGLFFFKKTQAHTLILPPKTANVEDFGDSEVPLSGFFAQPSRRKYTGSEENVSAAVSFFFFFF